MCELHNSIEKMNERDNSRVRFLEYDGIGSTVCYSVAFTIISFGYMLPWTALGSLISYYKTEFGVNFYVVIYCLYYLPGLPIAILQYLYDDILDANYGSQRMYLIRGVIGFFMLIVVLFTMIWVNDEIVLQVGFLLLGIGGWLCHGSSTMLASMFPGSAIAYLQIGFRFPELYSLIMASTLHLTSAAAEAHLRWFHGITAGMVTVALVVYIFLVLSAASTIFCSEKDKKARSDSISSFERTYVESDSLLLNRHGVYTKNYSRGHFIDDQYGSDLEESKLDNTSSNSDALLEWETEPIFSSSYFPSWGLPINCANSKDHCTEILCTVCESDSAYNNIVGESDNKTKKINHIQNKNKSGISVSLAGKKYCSIAPLCAALMITIWSSIFQAAFFAYVNSPNDRNIEQTLYFVRLFCDLLGRPLTFLPRPFFLKSNIQLLILSLIRALFLAIFFAYVFVPSFKANDTFLFIFEAIFSLLSGYICVLVYEYAANECTTQQERAHSANTLNMGFQLAAFSAVLMSVAISTSLSTAT